MDTRATLLRVAADLFATAPNRTPGDIERFTALALPLLDIVDHATRIAVARRLACVADTPRRVLERLLQDDGEIAREIVLRSSALDQDCLMTVAIDGGPAEAGALAERRDLDRAVARALSAHSSRHVVETLVANVTAPLDSATLSNLLERARQDTGLAQKLLARRDVDPALCAPLYPALDAGQRRRVRLAMTASVPRSIAPLDMDALTTFRLAVLRGGSAAFSKALAALLRVPLTAAEGIAADPTGEMPALALIASGLTREDTLAALLICASDTVRTSIPLIFSAAALHDETSRAVALAIVRAVLSGSSASGRPAHAPHFDPAEAPARAPQETRRSGGAVPEVRVIYGRGPAGDAR